MGNLLILAKDWRNSILSTQVGDRTVCGKRQQTGKQRHIQIKLFAYDWYKFCVRGRERTQNINSTMLRQVVGK